MKVKLVILIAAGYNFDEDDTYILPTELGDFAKIVDLALIPKSGDLIAIDELKKFDSSFRIMTIRHHIKNIPEFFIKISDQSSLGDELHYSRKSRKKEIEKLLLSRNWKKIKAY